MQVERWLSEQWSDFEDESFESPYVGLSYYMPGNPRWKDWPGFYLFHHRLVSETGVSGFENEGYIICLAILHRFWDSLDLREFGLEKTRMTCGLSINIWCAVMWNRKQACSVWIQQAERGQIYGNYMETDVDSTSQRTF